MVLPGIEGRKGVRYYKLSLSVMFLLTAGGGAVAGARNIQCPQHAANDGVASADQMWHRGSKSGHTLSRLCPHVPTGTPGSPLP